MLQLPFFLLVTTGYAILSDEYTFINIHLDFDQCMIQLPLPHYVFAVCKYEAKSRSFHFNLCACVQYHN